MFTFFTRTSLLKNALRSLPIVLGASFMLRPRSIYNESFFPQNYSPPVSYQVKAKPGELSKQLNYHDLCIGSITGLFSGVIIGRLSTAIAYLSVSLYLFLQFLESRNIITVPWRSVITLGEKKIDLRSLCFENLSFKLSFVLSFVLAAWNV